MHIKCRFGENYFFTFYVSNEHKIELRLYCPDDIEIKS